MLKEREDGRDKIFIFRDIVEIRIPREVYRKLEKRYSKEYIISFAEEKKVLNRVTGRELIFVTKESGIPLLGHTALES